MNETSASRNDLKEAWNDINELWLDSQRQEFLEISQTARHLNEKFRCFKCVSQCICFSKKDPRDGLIFWTALCEKCNMYAHICLPSKGVINLGSHINSEERYRPASCVCKSTTEEEVVRGPFQNFNIATTSQSLNMQQPQRDIEEKYKVLSMTAESLRNFTFGTDPEALSALQKVVEEEKQKMRSLLPSDRPDSPLIPPEKRPDSPSLLLSLQHQRLPTKTKEWEEKKEATLANFRDIFLTSLFTLFPTIPTEKDPTKKAIVISRLRRFLADNKLNDNNVGTERNSPTRSLHGVPNGVYLQN